ncbi:MAG: hypothetical protein KDE00_13665 [Rhodobacteraceae bacterium]|nr:hypothetical protein [Paracoccaceae bacterium]
MFGATSNPWFDRSILMTSATEGLGPDLARALVARGARPVAVGRDGAALARLSEDLGGISWIADDALAPERAIPIARWIADTHAGLGGFICALPLGPGAATSLAPLALLALAGLSPDAPVGLVLPDAPGTWRVARLAARLRQLRWSVASGSALTAIIVPDGFAAAGQELRAMAAGRTLDALAARRASVRIAAPRPAPIARSALVAS